MMKYLLVLLFFFLFSCSKNGGDILNSTMDSLTVFPLHYSDIGYLQPLGNLNPPGHTFPTNHCYLYLKDPAVKVPVLAPGNIRLVRIRQNTRSTGGVVNGQDYKLIFAIGNGYVLEFEHMSELSPEIAHLFSSAEHKDCNTPYELDGTTYQHCAVTVNLSVAAGEKIGKAGGQAGQYALDMGLYVANKEPPHNAVCPFDVYKQVQRSDIQSRLTDTDPTTTAPSSLCGQYIFEVPGTAKGLWQKAGAPLYPEEKHIALVEYNQQPVFSIGISQTGLASGVYDFTIQNSGVINRKFEDISADGHTYCFNIHPWSSGSGGSLLLKMTDRNNLILEYRPGCDCSCNIDYTFASDKVSYHKPEL